MLTDYEKSELKKALHFYNPGWPSFMSRDDQYHYGIKYGFILRKAYLELLEKSEEQKCSVE